MTKQTEAAARLFRPNKQESKAMTTDTVARSIIDAEVAARDAKTARLRAARLEQEAKAPAPPVKPGRKPAARKA